MIQISTSNRILKEQARLNFLKTTPILTQGKLDALNLRILAWAGFKLDCLSPPVQLSEFVDVFLRL
jgi:hypothetical protein